MAFENTQPPIEGTPGDLKVTQITKVAKGENWGVTVLVRNYDGSTIADLTGYTVYIAWASTPGGDPFLVFDESDEEVSLVYDPTAACKLSFTTSDMALIQPNSAAYGDVWLDPVSETEDGGVLQARIALTLKPSTRKTDPDFSDGPWLMQDGTWADSGIWDDSENWMEAA